MRNKSSKRAGHFFNGLLSIGATLSGVLLVFIMLSIAFDVVFRYSLNHPLEWAVEVSEYLLVGITFFAAAWVLKREGHVKMDQVINHLSRRTQNILNTVTSILSAMACLIMVWYGTLVTLEQIKTGDSYYTTLETPKWPISAVIVVGFILLLFQFLKRTHRYLIDLRASSNK